MNDLMCDRLHDATLSPAAESALGGPDPRLSRRRLLGGAAGGFMLAASGLLLPEGVEAERQRPVERILNDPNERKGKNHKNRHRKNRNNKDRNDNDNDRDDNGPGSNGFPVRVEVNYTSGNNYPTTSPTYEIEVWKNNTGGKGWRLWKARHPVPPPSKKEQYYGERGVDEVVLVVHNAPTGPTYFRFRGYMNFNDNVDKPYLYVYQGTWNEKGVVNEGKGYFGGALAVSQRIDVPGFFIERAPDSATHKSFWMASST